MTFPLISVIIPIFNTQEYIVECLESVRNQTYTNYEVIIVNDGSTDNSERLILEFIRDKELEHFRLVSKPNGGLSSARNEGLRHATGEWIIFIDSDDWLEPTFFENLMNAEAKYHADFVLAGFRAYDIETGEFDEWSKYTVEYGELPKDLRSLTSFDYVWSRMYKKSIIDEYSLRFDEQVRFCEDNAFNFDYVSVIQSFACVGEIGYTYRRGHAGAMSKMAVTPHMRKHIREHMYGFCDRVPMEDIIVALKENRSFCRVMWNIQLTDIVVDILEKNVSDAKEKMRLPLVRELVSAFNPNTNKDKVLHFLWNKPFVLFKLCVIIFYKQVDKIKKIKWLSHILTH